jgi:hypothetical protein
LVAATSIENISHFGFILPNAQLTAVNSSSAQSSALLKQQSAYGLAPKPEEQRWLLSSRAGAARFQPRYPVGLDQVDFVSGPDEGFATTSAITKSGCVRLAKSTLCGPESRSGPLESRTRLICLCPLLEPSQHHATAARSVAVRLERQFLAETRASAFFSVEAN